MLRVKTETKIKSQKNILYSIETKNGLSKFSIFWHSNFTHFYVFVLGFKDPVWDLQKDKEKRH